MDRIQVVGHQRSGNHYLAALIEKNLYDSSDYVKHMSPSGHFFPKFGILKSPTFLFIFTHRNFRETADSIYRLRKRFNLAGVREDFFTKKIRELTPKKPLESTTEVNWVFKAKQQVNGRSGYFSQYPDLTLREWHQKYCDLWFAEAKARNNVIAVRYESLCLSVIYKKQVLYKIASLLDMTWKSNSFEDIKERVGYYSKEDKTWDKSTTK